VFRALALALTALVALPAVALAHAPGAPQPVTLQTELVAGGAGNQTDPHVAASLIAFTSIVDTTSEIGYRDVTTGAAGAIPNDGHRDSLPGVSGSLITFRRVFTDGSSTARPIMVFDVAHPELGAREVAPTPGARRAFGSAGADTVAFMQFTGSSSTASDVCVASLSDLPAPAQCLTHDGTTMSNRDPAVSPDGGTVTWAKCRTDGTGCDIYVVRRQAAGLWGTPLQLTDSTGEDILPDTDGQIVTYASNAADTGDGGAYRGDYDIWWENIDGTNEHQLVLSDAPGSIETNPSLSGGFISFERELPGSTNADLYLAEPAGTRFLRLTDTAAVDETLNDLSVAADGTARVVWAQPDGLEPGHNDIHHAAFSLAQGPLYSVCPLYETSRSFRLGGTAPIKLQLCDAAGGNLSSATTTLTVTGLVKRDSSAATAVADDTGNANPDRAFRYDAGLAGYIYNLSTKGLSRGTWELQFTTSTNPGHVYNVRFDVR
jgi:hypothetical protein